MVENAGTETPTAAYGPVVRYESQAARRRRRRQRQAERAQMNEPWERQADEAPPPIEMVRRTTNIWPWRARTRQITITECNCPTHTCYYQQIVERFGAVAHIDLEFGEPIPPPPTHIPVARISPRVCRGAVRPSAPARPATAATAAAGSAAQLTTTATAAATPGPLHPPPTATLGAWNQPTQAISTFHLPPINQPGAARKQACLHQLRILVPNGNHGGWANQSLVDVERLLSAAEQWWAANGCPPTEDQVLFTMYGDELWD